MQLSQHIREVVCQMLQPAVTLKQMTAEEYELIKQKLSAEEKKTASQEMPLQWTRDQVAAYLLCSKRQVDRLAKVGKLRKLYNVGDNSPRFSPKEVIRFANKRAPNKCKPNA